jgi:hypothetical protein
MNVVIVLHILIYLCKEDLLYTCAFAKACLDFQASALTRAHVTGVKYHFTPSLVVFLCFVLHIRCLHAGSNRCAR